MRVLSTACLGRCSGELSPGSNSRGGRNSARSHRSSLRLLIGQLRRRTKLRVDTCRSLRISGHPASAAKQTHRTAGCPRFRRSDAVTVGTKVVQIWSCSGVLDCSGSAEDDSERVGRAVCASPAGPIPAAEGEGTAIFAPDTPVSDVAAKPAHLIAWKGKVFDPKRGEPRMRLVLAVRRRYAPRSITPRVGSIRRKRSSLQDCSTIRSGARVSAASLGDAAMTPRTISS